MDTHQNCTCWRCFVQQNFTAVALLYIVTVSMVLTFILMHEDKIDDKYVTFFGGFLTGAFSTLTLALKGAVDKPHVLAPGTTEATLRVEPPAPVAPITEPPKKDTTD
jgi:hypothetical protein